MDCPYIHIVDLASHVNFWLEVDTVFTANDRGAKISIRFRSLMIFQ